MDQRRALAADLRQAMAGQDIGPGVLHLAGVQTQHAAGDQQVAALPQTACRREADHRERIVRRCLHPRTVVSAATCGVMNFGQRYLVGLQPRGYEGELFGGPGSLRGRIEILGKPGIPGRCALFTMDLGKLRHGNCIRALDRQGTDAEKLEIAIAVLRRDFARAHGLEEFHHGIVFRRDAAGAFRVDGRRIIDVAFLVQRPEDSRRFLGDRDLAAEKLRLVLRGGLRRFAVIDVALLRALGRQEERAKKQQGGRKYGSHSFHDSLAFGNRFRRRLGGQEQQGQAGGNHGIVFRMGGTFPGTVVLLLLQQQVDALLPPVMLAKARLARQSGGPFQVTQIIEISVLSLPLHFVCVGTIGGSRPGVLMTMSS